MTTNTTKLLAISTILTFLLVGQSAAQFDPFGDAPPRAIPAPAAPPSAAPTKKPTTDEDVAVVPRPKAVPMGPRQIRLHLMDGSTIAGDLSVASINVKTEFGELEVPINKIKKFTPGLDSFPELAAKIKKLFDDLGSDNYQTRETAHKEIVKFGLQIQNELERNSVDDGNAERKRHIEGIRKELEELSEEQDEFDDEGGVKPWIRGDTIVTTEFTIVGRIAEESFQITSKYGPLNVMLADVQLAERSTGEKAEMRKAVTVNGTHLVQKSFKATGLRVEKGDKIVVRADGQLTMSPWGSNMASTPDGGANYGWYIQNQISGGALVAKIGSKGNVIKVGSKSAFIAKQSGMLQFAIAMQAQYANQGYNYPGQYNVKIKVEPK